MLPTYEQMGWFGAIALVILRLAQGLSLGGEWGGAVALTTEHATEKNRPFFASLVSVGLARGVDSLQRDLARSFPNPSV